MPGPRIPVAPFPGFAVNAFPWETKKAAPANILSLSGHGHDRLDLPGRGNRLPFNRLLDGSGSGMNAEQLRDRGVQLERFNLA